MQEIILLLNPVYVTLFWGIVLIFYSPKKHPQKVFLGIFMFVAFIVYLSHFFYFTNQTEIYRFIDILYTWAFLLVYPLFHIYTHLLTTDLKFSFSKHFKYLILPTIIFVLNLAGIILMNKQEHVEFIEKVLTKKQSPSGIQHYMLFVEHIGRIVFGLQAFAYLFANFLLIKNHKTRLQDYYSNIEGRKLNWIQFFNICLFITSHSSVSLAILGRETFAADTRLLIIPSIIFSLMLFFIGLIGNTQNAGHTYFENENNNYKKNNNLYPNLSFPDIKSKLDELFENQRIFMNPDLKIWDVCKLIGTNRTYISKLINQEYGRNFCNHVNYYRVRHAKKLLSENPNLTNEQLADLSGFGSIKSLYRAFESLSDKPLSYYREKNIK